LYKPPKHHKYHQGETPQRTPQVVVIQDVVKLLRFCGGFVVVLWWSCGGLVVVLWWSCGGHVVKFNMKFVHFVVISLW